MWSLTLDILGLLGTIITASSFVFAIKTYNEKKRLENMVKSNLAWLADTIDRMRNNPALAHQHIDNVLNELALGEPTHEQRRNIIKWLAWAQGDSAATHRLLEVVQTAVISFQRGLYDTPTNTTAGATMTPMPTGFASPMNSVGTESRKSELSPGTSDSSH